MIDQLVAEAATYTTHKKHKTGNALIDVALRWIRATFVAVEKQYLLNILSVSL